MATTKAYSTQLAVLYLIGLYFAGHSGQHRSQEEYQTMLSGAAPDLPDKLEQVLAETEDIQ